MRGEPQAERRVVGERRGDREGLARAVAGAHVPRGLLGGPPGEAVEGAGRAQVAQGGEVPALGVGVVGQEGVGVGEGGVGGHPLALDQLEGRGGVEDLVDVEGGPAGQGPPQHHGEAGRPEEREGAPHPVVHGESHLAAPPPELPGDRAVRVEDRLGQGGGARGVDHDGVVVGHDGGGGRVEQRVVDVLAPGEELLPPLERALGPPEGHHPPQEGEGRRADPPGRGPDHLGVVAGEVGQVGVRGQSVLQHRQGGVAVGQHVVALGRRGEGAHGHGHSPHRPHGEQGGASSGRFPMSTATRVPLVTPAATSALATRRVSSPRRA